MKHNGHITQTQNNVADFGEGFPSSSGYSSFQSDYYKRQVPSTRTPSAEYNEIAVRYVYAQKIFAIKRSGTTFNYNKFFSDAGVVNVDEHEVVTAGQMADYLMRPTLGLMDLQVGPVMGASNENMYSYFSDSNSYVAGTGVFALPNESTYQGKSLIGKLTEIFNRLFNNNGDDAGFHIHAKSFTGGSLSIGAITSADGSYVNLNAGTSSSFTNPILSVIGQNGTNIREIIVRKNNNDSTDKPVGIAGQYVSPDAFDDYAGLTDAPGSGIKYTYLDFDRYFLRTQSVGRHQINANMIWIDGSNSDSFKFDIANFNFSNGYPSETRTVSIYRPVHARVVGSSISSYLIQSNYGSQQTVTLYNPGVASSGFNFVFSAIESATISSGTSGIVIQKANSPTKNYLLRCASDGSFAVRNSVTNSGNDIKLNFLASPVSPSAYSFLTSEAEQTVYGLVDSTFRSFLKFSNASGTAYAQHAIYSDSGYKSYGFYITDAGGIGSDRYLTTPQMSANSKFLVTNPSSVQNISSVGLKIDNVKVAIEDYFIKPLNIISDFGVPYIGLTEFYINKADIDSGNNMFSSTSTYTLEDDGSGKAKIVFNKSGVYEIYFNVMFDTWMTSATYVPFKALLETSLTPYIQQGVTYSSDASFYGKHILPVIVGEYIKFQFLGLPGGVGCASKRTQILIRRISD